jgi:D-alanine-D-alanine ligase
LDRAILDQFRGKRIAVLTGGASGEREVSLRSGANVLAALHRAGLDAVAVDPDRDLGAQLRQHRVDVVYNALHGGQGEDGTIQGALEALGIPYTGSGVLASALTLNKVLTKRVLRDAGLPTPDFFVFEPTANLSAQAGAAMQRLGLPLVIKPIAEGSSLGVRILHHWNEVEPAIEALLAQFGEGFAEKFIDGPEITVGCLGFGEGLRALPILELAPKKEFYDYEAKYTEGMTEFIIPARLPETTYTEAQRVAVAAHKVTRCHGLSRVDMHADRDGGVWIHELNSVPGMTELSDLPAQAQAADISYDELVLEILASALHRP